MTTNYSKFKYEFRNLQLDTDEVHVWCVLLDNLLPQIKILSQKLSSDEDKRARCFYFERDKNRYIIGRGVLRTIISGYIGVEASQLQFCYGKHGKPYLENNCNNPKLYFNMSHSDNLALYAFSCNRKVGIDIERIRDLPDMEQLAECSFSYNDKIVFHTMPGDMKRKVFFECWARKEAYLKGVGEGLWQQLDSFDVLSKTGDPANLLTIGENSQKTTKWYVQDLSPAFGFAAACASEGFSRLCRYQWAV